MCLRRQPHVHAADSTIPAANRSQSWIAHFSRSVWAAGQLALHGGRDGCPQNRRRHTLHIPREDTWTCKLPASEQHASRAGDLVVSAQKPASLAGAGTCTVAVLTLKHRNGLDSTQGMASGATPHMR